MTSCLSEHETEYCQDMCDPLKNWSRRTWRWRDHEKYVKYGFQRDISIFLMIRIIWRYPSIFIVWSSIICQKSRAVDRFNPDKNLNANEDESLLLPFKRQDLMTSWDLLRGYFKGIDMTKRKLRVTSYIRSYNLRMIIRWRTYAKIRRWLINWIYSKENRISSSVEETTS